MHINTYFLYFYFQVDNVSVPFQPENNQQQVGWIHTLDYEFIYNILNNIMSDQNTQI